MRSRTLLSLALLGLIAVLPPALADDETKKEPKVIPQSVPELEAEILKVMEKTKTPGMAITLVSKEGELWTAGLGLADVATKRPATAETPFRIGSITKSLVALSALQLVEQGKLSLDDTLRSRAPEIFFENPWEDTDPVRIVHLLEHTAGFDDLRLREYALSKPNIPLKEALDYYPVSRVSRWRPGTRFSYCNSGPAVVAYVIAKITGQTFEDYVAEHFFKPLGMATATFFETPNLTTLYHPDGQTPYPYWHVSIRPAGSVNASAQDMARYLALYLGRGSALGHTFVSPASLDRMEVPTTTWSARAGLSTGYGLHNYTNLGQGFVFHGHNGGVEGGLATMNYLPEHGLGYAFMINSGSGEAYEELERLVQSYLTRQLVAPPVPALATLPLADRDSFSGYYRPDSPRQELFRFIDGLLGTVRVSFDERGLSASPLLGETLRLHAMTDRTLRGAAADDKAEERVATTALIDDPREGLLIQIDGDTFKKASGLTVWGERLLIVFWLLMVVSAGLFAPIWGLRFLVRQLKGWPTMWMRVVPLAAVACLVGAVVLFLLSAEDLIFRFGNLTPWSFGFFLGTLGFGVLSILGLWLVLRARKAGVNRWAYLHSLVFSLANVLVTGYLATWGWIGIRLWR